jgi:hypothetical protein
MSTSKNAKRRLIIFGRIPHLFHKVLTVFLRTVFVPDKTVVFNQDCNVGNHTFWFKSPSLFPEGETRRLFMVKRGENNQIEGVFLGKSLPPTLALYTPFVYLRFRHPESVQDVQNHRCHQQRV